MQLQTVSKSEFKAKALEYLRLVELKKIPLTITHAGRPVVRVVPTQEENEEETFKKLGEAIVIRGDITRPVAVEDWEVLK